MDKKAYIYISKTYDNTIEGLIISYSKDIALTFFQAKGYHCDSIETIDLEKLSEQFDEQPYFSIIGTHEKILVDNWGTETRLRITEKR